MCQHTCTAAAGQRQASHDVELSHRQRQRLHDAYRVCTAPRCPQGSPLWWVRQTLPARGRQTLPDRGHQTLPARGHQTLPARGHQTLQARGHHSPSGEPCGSPRELDSFLSLRAAALRAHQAGGQRALGPCQNVLGVLRS